MRLIAIPVVFLLGAIASRVLMLHAPRAIAIDLTQPLVVATNWHGYGLACIALLFTTLAIAGCAYVALLRATSLPPVGVLLGCAALALAAGWIFTPVFSSDVYAYASYGEMARQGIDPYHRAALPHGDALIDAARWQWSGTIPLCVYGTSFVALAQTLVSATASFGARVSLDAFRLLSACALLVCGALLACSAGSGDRQRARRYAALLALNPVALWSAIEGHNDTLMLAIVLSGIVVFRRAPFIGSAIVTLGALIKAPALVAGAAVAADALLQRARPARATIAGVACGVLLTAAFSYRLFDGVGNGVAVHGVYAPLASPHALLAFIGTALGFGNARLAIVFALLLVAGSVAGTMFVALRLLRARDRDGWVLLALAAWIAIPNPYPWYSLWLLPLLTIATRRRLIVAIVGLSFISLIRYVPDAVATPTSLLGILLAGFAAAPFVWLAASSVGVRRRRTAVV